MNQLLLEIKMKERGKSNEYMATKLNMAPSTYYRKRNGDSEFTRKEMQVIRFELELTSKEFNAIFFRTYLRKRKIERRMHYGKQKLLRIA